MSEAKQQIEALMNRYGLGRVVNPGGAAFINAARRINIQVSDMDYDEDLRDLKAGLTALGLEV